MGFVNSHIQNDEKYPRRPTGVVACVFNRFARIVSVILAFIILAGTPSREESTAGRRRAASNTMLEEEG